MQEFKYRNITVSGKIAVGTSTLSKHLKQILGWQYINTGELQRQYDRQHGIDENQQGAVARPDSHEREMEAMAQKILTQKQHIIYEAWLSGFVSRDIEGVLKVLVICSDEAVRIDRVVNRDNMTIMDAKRYIRARESENIDKWQKLYGNYDFWDPKYYDLVIDTYASGQLETVGRVLDKLGYKGSIKIT
ncbi:cytidylate kinase family protein [Candidatus Gottesmanbacteria bacterium]|nr:cytidylate kinase family protein [Candidatus Gottesmanbacteria bacterium]